MLTGTPLDLTFIPELLEWLGAAIPIAWLLLLLAAIALLMWKVRSLAGRLLGVAGVLVLLVALPFWKLGELRKQAVVARAENDAEQAKFRERLAVAEAQFKKRCETAGEFIYKTVPDVKGVVWMKWRPREVNHGDQFRLDDPYGNDCYGEPCLKELLVATEGRDLKYEGEYLHPYGTGYEFVEAVAPEDGKPYRYRLRLYRPHDRDPKWLATEVRSELFKEPIGSMTARYGLSWDDISTREDRENWIAGGSLSVVDLKTNETVARRVGFMMDRGMGSTAGFRSPWLFAGDNACPAKQDDSGKRTDVGHTRRFAFKVLQPIKGAKQ